MCRKLDMASSARGLGDVVGGVGERRRFARGGGIAFAGGRDHPSAWMLAAAGVERGRFCQPAGPEVGVLYLIQRRRGPQRWFRGSATIGKCSCPSSSGAAPLASLNSKISAGQSRLPRKPLIVIARVKGIEECTAKSRQLGDSKLDRII